MKALVFHSKEFGLLSRLWRATEAGETKDKVEMKTAPRWRCREKNRREVKPKLGRSFTYWNTTPLQTPDLQGLILGGKTSSGRGSNHSVLKFAFWALPSPSESNFDY